MNNNKEVVKKIRSIFEEMQIIRYSCRIDSLIRRNEKIYDYDNIRYSCYIDSLIRIYEEMYDCEKCALVDTVDTVSTVRDVMCPMVMKRECKVLR